MNHYRLAFHIGVLCREKEEFEIVMRNICTELLEIHPEATVSLHENSIILHTADYTLQTDTAVDGEQLRSIYRKHNVNINFLIHCTTDNELCLIEDLPIILKSRNDHVLMLYDDDSTAFSISSYASGWQLTVDRWECYGDALRKSLYESRIAIKNIFTEYDDIMRIQDDIIRYADEHFEQLKANSDKAARIVITTLAYELGIACPSLIKHRIVKGHKRGRIIKEIPEKDDYTLIGYDSSNKPLFFRPGNEYQILDSSYFFEYNGYLCAVEMCDRNSTLENYGKHYPYINVYRALYDEADRVKEYIHIESSRLYLEKYDYPDDESQPITCHTVVYYSSRRNKDIPAGYDDSPVYLDYYEISPDLKTIRSYSKVGNEYKFSGEIVSGGKKTAKPKPADNTYERLEIWLDDILSKPLPENAEGLYFCLDEGTEDGFGIDMFFTSRFDANDDDWACDDIANPGDFTVSTNGQCEWEDILKFAKRLMKKYLREGNKRDVIKTLKGAGTGFADGDVDILWKNGKSKTNNDKKM